MLSKNAFFPVFLACLCFPLITQANSNFSWQENHAEVHPHGDLTWKPKPFTYETGKAVRYIDFKDGKDSNDGKTKNTPWQHHPGDKNAKGVAKNGANADTYVFKRGVVYRGSFSITQHGKLDAPIRVTSDPSWGKGEAVISGSQIVSGWKKSGIHKDIPNGDKVWAVDVPWLARNVWLVNGKTVTRVPLARHPNWTETNPDDVNSNWFELQQPQWWTGKNKMKVGKTNMHLGVDKKNLTASKEVYEGAIIRSEWGIVMGTPFPSKVERFDQSKKGVAFQGPWFRDSGKLMTGNRYYLEDKPQFLDEAGEFWAEKKNKTGSRIYLRLPGDKDPNTVQVEVGRYYNLIEDVTSATSPLRTDVLRGDYSKVPTRGVKHVSISGLTFRFTNTWWDLEFPAWMHKDVDNAAIRMLGNTDQVVIRNNVFEHVGKAVRVAGLIDACSLGTVSVMDNRIAYTDKGAISLTKNKGGARFNNAIVMRNSLFNIGRRPHRQDHGHAISVNFAETMELAGNILDRCYGAGLFLFGGKGSGRPGDAPLSRMLVYQNKITDPLLSTNDWGGIETWQGGPAYVFNNISANPGGYWHWGHKKGGAPRFGHAYYLDGAFKNYLFNNIAWGKSNVKGSPLANTAAFQEIHSYQNTFFNNSAYRFQQGTRRQASHAGRNKYIGNVFQDISVWLYRHNSPAKTAADGNAADAGKKKDHVEYNTLAYAKNVTHGIAKYGVIEPSGRWLETQDAFDSALAQHKAKTQTSGVVAKKAPLPNADKKDFRLAANSEAVDNGATVFVPWSLYGMVAEWNFTPDAGDPTYIMDEHWFMTHYHSSRNDYSERPMFPLKGVNVDRSSFVDGKLENWTQGALKLNGKDQYATIAHDVLVKPFSYKKKNKKKKTTEDIVVNDVYSPAINEQSFILEAVVRADGDGDGGIILQKRAKQGYSLTVNAAGKVEFVVVQGSTTASIQSKTALKAGTFHHILAECDRKMKTLRLYIDGKSAAHGSGVGKGSIANTGDVYVGGSPQGQGLKATFDFVRIAHGTLADSRTTIEELHAWQFNGPQFRDFTGRAPIGQRDAGAIERTDGSVTMQ